MIRPAQATFVQRGEVIQTLSILEREFLRDLVAGNSQGIIASRLNLMEAEALGVRQTLMRKLGATCTADAVRIGIYAGL